LNGIICKNHQKTNHTVQSIDLNKVVRTGPLNKEGLNMIVETQSPSD